jgi:hypothetical protein
MPWFLGRLYSSKCAYFIVVFLELSHTYMVMYVVLLHCRVFSTKTFLHGYVCRPTAFSCVL